MINRLRLIAHHDSMLRRHMLKGFGNRAQIAHSVINNHDALHKAFNKGNILIGCKRKYLLASAQNRLD
jgi:hypothetical protein